MLDTVVLGGVTMTKHAVGACWFGNANGNHFNMNQAGNGTWSLTVEDSDANTLASVAGLSEDALVQQAASLFPSYC